MEIKTRLFKRGSRPETFFGFFLPINPQSKQHFPGNFCENAHTARSQCQFKMIRIYAWEGQKISPAAIFVPVIDRIQGKISKWDPLRQTFVSLRWKRKESRFWNPVSFLLIRTKTGLTSLWKIHAKKRFKSHPLFKKKFSTLTFMEGEKFNYLKNGFDYKNAHFYQLAYFEISVGTKNLPNFHRTVGSRFLRFLISTNIKIFFFLGLAPGDF